MALQGIFTGGVKVRNLNGYLIAVDGEVFATANTGGTTNAFFYQAKTSITSGDPGSGHLIWNNATQISATQLNVSHLTDTPVEDIDIFLSAITIGNKLIVQDRNDSANYQSWTVSGAPTQIGSTYWTIPVTLLESQGTGTTGFANNHDLLFIIQSGGSGVSSVGICMPPAFNVCCSPVTGAGNLCVTAAGVASQYVRGDGVLADFPDFGGGAGSQQFYFNGGVSQGTVDGISSFQMSRNANLGSQVTFSGNAPGTIAQFVTDIGSPNQTIIPAGSWFFSAYFGVSTSGGTPTVNAEIYKWDGATSTLIATSTTESILLGTSISLYNFAAAVPQTTLSVNDRIIVRFNIVNAASRTIVLYTQGNTLSSVTTTFSNAITSLNGLTSSTQTFACSNSGTDFTISSTGCTHTFNLPTASCANRGVLSASDYCRFNNSVAFCCFGCFNYLGLLSVNTPFPLPNQFCGTPRNSFIWGSGNRLTDSCYSFLGGFQNCINTTANHNFIITGNSNTINSTNGQTAYGIIGTGNGNNLNGGSWNTILNGSTNQIIGCNTVCYCWSTIINGSQNTISCSSNSTILGGICNSNNFASFGVILGGQCNTVTGQYSGVANICGVTASADCTFYFCNICALGTINGIVASNTFCYDSVGTRNIRPTSGVFTFSTISSSIICDNAILSGCLNIIGAGGQNPSLPALWGDGSKIGNTIAGGISNCICSTTYFQFPGSVCLNLPTYNSFIGGGTLNFIDGRVNNSSIAGGSSNRIGNMINQRNCITGCNNWTESSFIGGGNLNTISASSLGPDSFSSFLIYYTSIVGGQCNFNGTSFSLIGGGFCNRIDKFAELRDNNFIGTGCCNIICDSIGAGIINGFRNTVCNTCYSISLGGQCNNITGCYSGAFGCGITASANWTFYFCNICALGNIIKAGGTSDDYLKADGNIQRISSGTAAPTGGNDGDIYLQYV